VVHPQPDGTATLHVGKVGIKLSFLYIKCRLGLAGVKQTLPSEGYSRWAFGWHIDADARAGLRDLFDGVRSGGEAVHAPGLPDVEVQKGAPPCWCWVTCACCAGAWCQGSRTVSLQVHRRRADKALPRGVNRCEPGRVQERLQRPCVGRDLHGIPQHPHAAQELHGVCAAQQRHSSALVPRWLVVPRSREVPVHRTDHIQVTDASLAAHAPMLPRAHGHRNAQRAGGVLKQR